jgi:hypothetical protein
VHQESQKNEVKNIPPAETMAADAMLALLNMTNTVRLTLARIMLVLAALMAANEERRERSCNRKRCPLFAPQHHL